MYCYDEQGKLLGVVGCVPKVGEEHAWGDKDYVCIGDGGPEDCRYGKVFKLVKDWSIQPTERG